MCRQQCSVSRSLWKVHSSKIYDLIVTFFGRKRCFLTIQLWYSEFSLSLKQAIQIVLILLLFFFMTQVSR